ncbi:hypothetical protein DOT_3241 [Desulfosporosinus sp. OT]|nr:hypothetical protein DOT_3241 [Desulfosporosinus sp. OT]
MKIQSGGTFDLKHSINLPIKEAIKKITNIPINNFLTDLQDIFLLLF